MAPRFADQLLLQHILLDDVLSAVDSHTAQHLFQKCLKGRIMRHRTCVLVTHAVDLCLPGSAFVVSMDNGVVVASGTPDQVSLTSSFVEEVSKHAEAEALTSTFTIEAIASGQTDEEVSEQEAAEKMERAEKLKLVKDETQSEGAVSGQVYLCVLLPAPSFLADDWVAGFICALWEDGGSHSSRWESSSPLKLPKSVSAWPSAGVLRN